MRKLIISILAGLLLSQCALLHDFGGGDAKANAVQALVTTTRSAVLLMTAAGIAYDAGAFGAPGSPRAEDTWKKISVESVRMGEALTAWSEAIKANKDASVYQSMVSQALAVIGALLPTRTGAALILPPLHGDPFASSSMLAIPDSFRLSVGGA